MNLPGFETNEMILNIFFPTQRNIYPFEFVFEIKKNGRLKKSLLEIMHDNIHWNKHHQPKRKLGFSED